MATPDICVQLVATPGARSRMSMSRDCVLLCSYCAGVLNIRRGIGLERAHVLGALEGARVGAIILAHAAFELLDRFVFVFLHPFAHLAFEHPDVFDPAAQSAPSKASSRRRQP